MARQELEQVSANMSFGDRMMLGARTRRQQQEAARAWWPCQAWENWLQHAIAERDLVEVEQQPQTCRTVRHRNHHHQQQQQECPAKKLMTTPEELPVMPPPEVLARTGCRATIFVL